MRRAAPALLLALGLLWMGDGLLGAIGAGSAGRALQVFGAAVCAAPAPRGLAAAGGLEAFSTAVTLEWTDRGGEAHRLPLTRRVLGRIRGPSMRRRVYLAALADGPVLSSSSRNGPMFRAVIAHALAGPAPLLREIGVDPESVAGPLRVVYAPRPGGAAKGLPLVLVGPRP